MRILSVLLHLIVAAAICGCSASGVKKDGDVIASAARMRFTSRHFIYGFDQIRAWKSEEILAILEACFEEYIRITGVQQSSLIIVDQATGPLKAFSEGRKRIVVNFPKGFGLTREQRELAFHFFAHELLHFWIGGYVQSREQGDGIEGFVQYMANRTLLQHKFVSSEFITQDSAKRRDQILRGINKSINEYYLRLRDLDERSPHEIDRMAKKLALLLQGANDAGHPVDISSVVK